MTLCQTCGKEFYRSPSFHANAARRGSVIKFCSRACTDAGRSQGVIGTKKKTGITLTCEVCAAPFYRSKVQSARNFRFCSEPCRLEAYKRNLVDRSGPRPQRKLGTDIRCMFCNEIVYRKASMVSRNINKTCGKLECVSAYGRSLWGLQPRDEKRVRQPKRLRKYRVDNFSALQRKNWLDDKCARCGTTENLTLDHIVAVAAGGKAVRENAQTLCGPCNNWKAKNVDKVLTGNRSPRGGLGS